MSGVGATDFDEIQALVRMTRRSEPFVAKIAMATLAVVESRRDAEIRAATNGAALEAAEAKLTAIRRLLASTSDQTGDPEDLLRRITVLVG